jgi:pantoate--beta-alanine ligase
MQKVIKTIDEWQKIKKKFCSEHITLGFVPTMGALHEGHLSLIARSAQENDFTVVSIFVNPTQFNNLEDLKAYPRQLADDLALLKSYDVDYVFTPCVSDMYPDDYRYQVHESRMSKEMEGQHRPGHFDGVLTIVMKLLQLISPSRAYFGEKDYQQLELIKEMANAFFMPVDVIGCPIMRDEKGLALSSRNARLSEQGLMQAQSFAKILRSNVCVDAIKGQLKELGISIDYIEEKAKRRFAAVTIEDVRLIDNVLV